MKVILIPGKVWTYVKTEDESAHRIIDNTLSVLAPHRFYVKSFKMKLWDGKKRFYDLIRQRFLTGFLSLVQKNLKQRGYIIDILDSNILPKPMEITEDIILNGVDKDRWEKIQLPVLKELLREGRGVLRLATSGGKCFGKSTKILMYDGSIKNIEDIQVGDKLMGDDSLPRNVISLGYGYDELFKVQQINGMDYVVNKEHTLCLKQYKRKITKGVLIWSKNLIELSVKDYLNLPKYRKHCLKGYKVSIDFEYKDVKINPYFLGLWLGNGRKDSPVVWTMYKETVLFLQKYAADLGLKCVQYPQKNNKASGYALVNIVRSKTNPKLKNIMLEYNLINNKHIPNDYKHNSREIRLQVLAGFVDTDGYVNHKCIYFTITDDALAQDIIFLARSLGFGVYTKVVSKTIKSINFSGIYRYICIKGDISEIPIVLSHKKTSKRLKNKDVLVSGIQIKPVGFGDYYGIVIDGNKKFLLEDFTVVHNTEIMAGIAKVMRDKKVLILVHRIELLKQTIERLENRLGEKIGQISANDAQMERVNVGMVMSVWSKRQELRKYLKEIDVVISDECFSGNTLVMVDYNKVLPIKDIVGNDVIKEVLAYDLDKKQIVKKSIVRKIKREYKGDRIKIEINNHGYLYNIICTPSHKIYIVGKGYIEAYKVLKGDIIIKLKHLIVDAKRVYKEPELVRGELEAFVNNSYAEITSVKLLKYPLGTPRCKTSRGFVYNLEVADVHNYFVCATRNKSMVSKKMPILVGNCHRSGSAIWSKVLQIVDAKWRFGVSGTPLKGDDARDMTLIGLTGNVVEGYTVANLVEAGYAVLPIVKLINTVPMLGKYDTKGKYNVVYNKVYGDIKLWELVKNIVIGKHGVLIFTERVEICLELAMFLKKFGINAEATYGGLEDDKRIQVLKDLKDKRIDVLVCTTVLDEGIDVSNISTVVFMTSNKSIVRILQRIGRGVRIEDGKDNVEIIDFIIDAQYLKKHILHRVKIYEQEQFKIEFITI